MVFVFDMGFTVTEVNSDLWLLFMVVAHGKLQNNRAHIQ